MALKNFILIIILFTSSIYSFNKFDNELQVQELQGNFQKFQNFSRIKENKKNSENIFIIGGHEVDIKDYPYQAAIHMFDEHFCGGAIISDTAILTAAHCISAFHESILSVRVGTSKTHSDGITIGIKSRIIHPNFNKLPGDYDIGIVILVNKLNFTNTIQPIKLQRLPTFEGELAVVSGWGRTETVNYSRENLRAATVRISNQKKCFLNYMEAGYQMTNRMLCAGLENGGHDACQGDSGGPLICKFSKKLCGIVSFGKGCALNCYPGIYTKISRVRKWIEQWL